MINYLIVQALFSSDLQNKGYFGHFVKIWNKLKFFSRFTLRIGSNLVWFFFPSKKTSDILVDYFKKAKSIFFSVDSPCIFGMDVMS